MRPPLLREGIYTNDCRKKRYLIMCGITGFYQSNSLNNRSDRSGIVSAMLDRLSHRGPDDCRIWMNAKREIVLGHNRLAIIDVSENGSQPMQSVSGRFCIAYNGEIYNHRELRNELMKYGARFRGHSDTEVLLAALEQWGIQKTLCKLAGMFAFALWDAAQEVLYLVRDRVGEKPLYYGWLGNSFLFASELKAFRAHPDWRGDIDRNVLASYLRYNYVPAPFSIYRGVYKLPAGSFLAVHGQAIEQRQAIIPFPVASPTKGEIVPVSYWSLPERYKVLTADEEQSAASEGAVAELDQLLCRVVEQHLYADVPSGMLLSGGIDSSTIAGIASAHCQSKLKTFTVGFSEAEYDESRYAADIARYLGTDHTQVHVSAREALDVVSDLPTIYDEPFADASQIPTVLISRMARKSVKVALSGDGGDELFGGYNRYLWLEKMHNIRKWLPPTIAKAVAYLLVSLSPASWDRAYRLLPRIVATRRRVGESLYKLAESLSASDPREMYWRAISQWSSPDSTVKGGFELDTLSVSRYSWGQFPGGYIQDMMYLDSVSYLPDDILVKTDRASMSTGLELRAPFLDTRVVDFALRQPLNVKIRNGQTKWLLRQLLYKYVPRQLVARPKMGFAVPVADWLRGPLKDWAESLINEKRLMSEDYFHSRPILDCWKDHLSGRRNHQYRLWGILMFQAWLEQQKA